ncbi:glutaredoxin family protein [Sanguibacter sp. A247]|uniref:glutaredoxin family protein n=1 Tax=unclassified Sanguibacter TaxID=2645534 RepID=UPI003FD8B9D0
MAQNITMYGAGWCGDCTRAKALLDREGIEYTYVDVEHDEAARLRAIEIAGRQNIPVIVFEDGTHLVEPSNPELLAKARG